MGFGNMFRQGGQGGRKEEQAPSVRAGVDGSLCCPHCGARIRIAGAGFLHSLSLDSKAENSDSGAPDTTVHFDDPFALPEPPCTPFKVSPEEEEAGAAIRGETTPVSEDPENEPQETQNDGPDAGALDDGEESDSDGEGDGRDER